MKQIIIDSNRVISDAYGALLIRRSICILQTFYDIDLYDLRTALRVYYTSCIDTNRLYKRGDI